MENSDASYYATRKEEDSVDRLLGSLSPIPGETHDLSSMDQFSIITSQAVSIQNVLQCIILFFCIYSAIAVSSKEGIGNEADC